MPWLERLCEASRRGGSDPYGFEWPASVGEGWFMTPELISIHGTKAWDSLDAAQRMRLSFFEAVNFFSLNVHGEKALVAGVAERLHAPRFEGLSAYLHHFLEEENRHMVWFSTFCRRYAGRLYPDRKVLFPREFAEGEEDLLFFAKIVLFEEIVDGYNARMAKDGRLNPIAREINRMHHVDETRHLAFGRRVVRDLYQAGSWTPGVRRRIADTLSAYVEQSWREYCNPDVYRDAGVPETRGIRPEPWSRPMRFLQEVLA